MERGGAGQYLRWLDIEVHPSRAGAVGGMCLVDLGRQSRGRESLVTTGEVWGWAGIRCGISWRTASKVTLGI